MAISFGGGRMCELAELLSDRSLKKKCNLKRRQYFLKIFSKL